MGFFNFSLAIYRGALKVKSGLFILIVIILGVGGFLKFNSSSVYGLGESGAQGGFMVKNINIMSIGGGVRVVLSRESSLRSEYYRRNVFDDIDLGDIPVGEVIWKSAAGSGEHYPVGIFVTHDSRVGIISDRKHAYRVYREAGSRVELDYTISKDQIDRINIDDLIFDIDKEVVGALQGEIRGME